MIKIEKLINAGRLDPVLETDRHGIVILLGYRRKKASRKEGIFLLKKPRAWINVKACQEGSELTPGAALIMQERRRQVTHEGYDVAHDDRHTDGSLAAAAKCYMTEPEKRETRTVKNLPKITSEKPDDPLPPLVDFKVPLDWPWEPKWWKPGPDRIRELTKAGALYLAEAARLGREGLPGRDMEFRAKDCAQLIDDIYLVGVTDNEGTEK